MLLFKRGTRTEEYIAQYNKEHPNTGGGLGLAVGAGVLGLPVRAAVAHIPAEDGAEET